MGAPARKTDSSAPEPPRTARRAPSRRPAGPRPSELVPLRFLARSQRARGVFLPGDLAGLPAPEAAVAIKCGAAEEITCPPEAPPTLEEVEALIEDTRRWMRGETTRTAPPPGSEPASAGVAPEPAPAPIAQPPRVKRDEMATREGAARVTDQGQCELPF